MSEPVATRWWWLRHAPVTNDGGCVYGQKDVEADFSNRAAFEALAAALPRRAVWVSSHLSRTRGTLAAVAEAGLPAPEVLIERDLVEQHFGAWQGQPRHEVYRLSMDWRRFWLTPAEATPPGGESFVAVVRRVAPVMARLNVEHAGRDIVVAAHGGTIRAALVVALGLAPEAALGFVIDNLSLTRLDHIAHSGPDGDAEAWRVIGVNLPPDARPGALVSAPPA